MKGVHIYCFLSNDRTQQCSESIKSCQRSVAKTGHGTAHTLHVTRRLAQVSLAEKLVGIAHYLLFQTVRSEVTMRQRQLLRLYLGDGEPRPRVAFAHESVAKQSQLVKHLASQNAVAYVGLGAVAVNTRGINPHDAYVVKHGGLMDKLRIHRYALRNEAVAYRGGKLCHLVAVNGQHLMQRPPAIIKP